MHILTSQSKPADLLRQIYAETHVLGYSNSYRPKKLRKVCPISRGLDLRKPKDVIFLARALNIIAAPAIQPTPIQSTSTIAPLSESDVYTEEVVIMGFGKVFTCRRHDYAGSLVRNVYFRLHDSTSDEKCLMPVEQASKFVRGGSALVSHTGTAWEIQPCPTLAVA